MISVVCPFYNEEAIIEASVRAMLKQLETLAEQWELIVVDDGSTDRSAEIVSSIARESPRLRIVGYSPNRGRGYAIRAGAAQARGELLVTTEIDSSWGDDIVHRLAAELRSRPDIDMVIASPHLPGGGYVNVPWHRVLLSTWGNLIIRSALTYGVTMNTGMTRGYRREKFLALPLDDDGKEMHLEIVNKALAFGYRIGEIPAVLEWKTHKLAATPGATRKSSSRIPRLVRSHLLFSLLVAPFRYFMPVSVVLTLAAFVFFSWGVVNLFNPAPSIFLFIAAGFLLLFSLTLFGIAVLAQQTRALQGDLWRVRSELRKGPPTQLPAEDAPKHT